MTHGRTRKLGLSAVVASGLMFASGAAFAAPMVTITAETFDTTTNTSTGSVSNSGTGSGGATSLNLADILNGYNFVIGSTATDGGSLDELFEIDIATTSANTPANTRIVFTVTASGYTGFSGPVPATTRTTPTNIAGDLDLVSTVGGTTVLDAQNITNTTSATVGSAIVNLTSPYTIEHVTSIQHFGSGSQTTSTDTTTTVVPLPATLGFLGAGLFGLGVALRRRRA